MNTPAPDDPLVSNITKATAVGAVAGGAAAPLIAYSAQVIETKTGVPAFVIMPLLGSAAAFFMRWAAKLNPAT